MGELRLDYQRNMQALPWGGLLLLLLAVLLLLASGLYYSRLSDEVERLQDTARRSARAAPHGPAAERSATALALEVRRANEVLRQLTTPWGGLFQTLETAGGKNVALLNFEPDLEKHQVKISGEAKNIPAMLDYIRGLENRDALGTVYLQSHHVQVRDPERPVRFVLQAAWVGKS